MWIAKKYFTKNNSSSKTEVDVRDILYLQMFYNELYALSKPENSSPFYRTYYHFLAPSFVIIFLLSNVAYIWMNVKSADGFSTCQVPIAVVQSVFKMYLFRGNGYHQIMNVINQLGSEEVRVQKNRHGEFLYKSIKKMVQLQMTFLILLLMCFILFMLAMQIAPEDESPSKDLYFKGWYPFDFSDPLKFKIFNTIQSLGVLYVAYSAFLCDVTAFIYMGILTLLIQVLCMNIEWVQGKSEKSSERISEIDFLKFQKDYVHFHQKILVIAETGQHFMGRQIFCHFPFSTLIIACVLFRYATGTDSDIVTSTAVLLAVLSQLFLYCFFGEILTAQSQQLEQALIRCKWLKRSLKFKKNLVFIMLRAKTPIQYTGLGFFSLSLATFVTMLKQSFSFYTLLREI